MRAAMERGLVAAVVFAAVSLAIASGIPGGASGASVNPCPLASEGLGSSGVGALGPHLHMGTLALSPPGILSPCPGGPTYLSFLGGGEIDGGYGVATDAEGNIYVAGNAGSDFPTTPGAYDTTYNGGGDLFVAKLNATAETLVYSTFLGGTGSDFSRQGMIAVDSTGSAYIAATTSSADFPTTPGALDTSYNGGGRIPSDVVVVKLSPSGDSLVYSTYVGGVVQDQARGIAVDGAGNTYVVGLTVSGGTDKGGTERSSPFPTTPGAYDQRRDGLRDLFVFKLNPEGSALVYSTFLGGSGGNGFEEDAGGIEIDASGNAYIVGSADVTTYPTTPGALDRSLGKAGDAVVTKLNAAGTGLVYSTFLGGSGSDTGRAIALDVYGNAHVVGYTGSTDFPTTGGAFDRSFNGGRYDVFVTKLNPQGNGLVYSTYVGGSADDWGDAAGVAVDSSGNLYATGNTPSVDFPTTPEAFDQTFNGGFNDAFVFRMNAEGSALVYSSYLGGSANDWGQAIRLDAREIVYVAGSTKSFDFPTSEGAYDQTFNGNVDAFLAKMI